MSQLASQFTLPTLAAATAALALLALAPGAQAQTPDSIGINFSPSTPSGPEYPLNFGTAGINPTHNFNDADGTSGSISAGSIFDSNSTGGKATTASLTYQGTTVGASQTDETLGPNYELTKGFLDIRNPAQDIITLSNIGFKSYDAYVFIDGAASSTVAYTANTTIQTVLNGTQYSGVFKPATLTTPGDYIEFTGLSGNFTLQAATTPTGAAPVDGFEIVNTGPAPVPEASSVVSLGLLLALGAGGLAVRARKARLTREV